MTNPNHVDLHGNPLAAALQMLARAVSRDETAHVLCEELKFTVFQGNTQRTDTRYRVTVYARETSEISAQAATVNAALTAEIARLYADATRERGHLDAALAFALAALNQAGRR